LIKTSSFHLYLISFFFNLEFPAELSLIFM
jgi:hypothetical protein